MIILKYVLWALFSYFITFIAIIFLFSIIGISGWYIVYVPFLSVSGVIIATLYLFIKGEILNGKKD